MGLGVSAKRNVWLSIAALAATCALTTPAQASAGAADPLNSLQTNRQAPWTVADFNGDHRLDLITAFSTPNLGGSYTYRLEIGLGGPEFGSLSFASADAKIRLRARDVDGDHDADLIVLGAISAKPIDLWLNDGAGHFRHGDVSKLPVESDSASLESPTPDDDTLATVSDDQSPLAAPDALLWAQDAVAERTAAMATQHFLSFDRANLRSRAPPR
jgi:hypothetical protein